MGLHHQLISISFIIILLMTLLLSPILCDISSTAKPPPKKYPIRTMLGNMYHRIRTNRTGYLLIPPLLRLAYQYGPNIIERMGNALGLGGAAGAGAAADGIDGLVSSALSGAIAPAGQALGALGAAGAMAPQIAPFGAAPMAFPPRPLFFRRR